MFGLFKKKTEKQKLYAEYDKLMKEAYELSKFNRSASDAKYVKADEIMKQLESLPS